MFILLIVNFIWIFIIWLIRFFISYYILLVKFIIIKVLLWILKLILKIFIYFSVLFFMLFLKCLSTFINPSGFFFLVDKFFLSVQIFIGIIRWVIFRAINELKIVSQLIYCGFLSFVSVLLGHRHLFWGQVLLLISFSCLVIFCICLKIFQISPLHIICKMSIVTLDFSIWRSYNLRTILLAAGMFTVFFVFFCSICSSLVIRLSSKISAKELMVLL